MAMKSAYEVLGVPANASLQDIEVAFERARLHYSRERIAADPDARDRWNDAQAAWQILRNPETRAALDRRITQPVQPPVRPVTIVPVEQPSTSLTLMRAGIALVVVLFAIGGFMTWRTSVHRAEAAAAEKAAAEQREKEDKEREAKAAKEEEERRKETARVEQNERRMAAETRRDAVMSNARSAYLETVEADARRREILHREATQAAEDRRQQYEAQRRIEQDRERVRNLCLQNYGRSNC